MKSFNGDIMVSNITIFGLNNTFAKEVGRFLSDELEMFFADVMELLKFDFINLVEAQNIVGKEYILKQERVKIKTLSSYENTIISCDFRSLNTPDNYANLHNGSVMIYLKLSNESLSEVNKTFKDSSDYDLFSDVTINYLESKADIVCDVSGLNVEDSEKKAVTSLMEYYKQKGV